MVLEMKWHQLKDLWSLLDACLRGAVVHNNLGLPLYIPLADDNSTPSVITTMKEETPATNIPQKENHEIPIKIPMTREAL
jgi:hypothetical protein